MPIRIIKCAAVLSALLLPAIASSQPYGMESVDDLAALGARMQTVIDGLDAPAVNGKLKSACRTIAKANPKAHDAVRFQVIAQGQIATDPSQKLDALGKCIAKALGKVQLAPNGNVGDGAVEIELPYKSADYLKNRMMVPDSLRVTIAQMKYAREASAYAPAFTDAIDANMAAAKSKCLTQKRSAKDVTWTYRFTFKADGTVDSMEPKTAGSDYARCIVTAFALSKVPPPPQVLLDSAGVNFELSLRDGPQTLEIK